MALLNITLNQDEILQLLANDRDAAFATLLQNSLNIILKAESAAQLKAEPYERTEERTGMIIPGLRPTPAAVQHSWTALQPI